MIINLSNNNAQLWILKKIQYNKIETFRIKINHLNTSCLYLMIGLIDFDKQKY